MASATNLTLALELYLKVLRMIMALPVPTIHELWTLYKGLPQELKERIQTCRYFVVIVGKTTLDSPYVRQEIAWAEEFGCTIISLWHNDAKIDAKTPAVLSTRHAITVKGESALDYELAVNQLLNSLGYATY